MRKFWRVPFLACSLACFTATAADFNQIDWKKLAPEILDHYSSLIRIDTSNPPGNETKAATYLKQVLEKEGIPAKIYAMEPARGNVVARLKGNGSKRPLLIMGHTDVVGVQRDKWTVDPFSAIRKDGYIYGRGSIDDKDKVTACLMVMLLLKRMNVPLDRDVIFLAEAGEEGTTTVGIDYMAREHWPEIEAEYAITEGGGGESRDGKPRFVGIATTEKVPRGARLVAHGTAGHGSVPRPDNAVVRLANAVGKIAAWQPPMRLNDTTRAYFERLATISNPQQAARYNHISDPARAPEIERYFAEHELSHNSILRTSISPTIIRAGFRSNVIPSEAEATLDIRSLPDENMEKFYDSMRRVIGDTSVEVVPNKEYRAAGPPSRIDTDMFRAFEKAAKKVYPGAITLPSMLTGATDNSELRAKGVQAYGFGPVIDEKDRLSNGAHSDDERLAESAFLKMVEFVWTSVVEVAAKP
jgi:acetylornithine deacetylase/succinyl-diaminopimelate desuccinylase-like protein